MAAEAVTDDAVDIIEEEIAAVRREIALLKAAIASDGVTVKGSKDQPVAHPALGALRGHRKTLAELIRVLQPEGPRTARARKAQEAKRKFVSVPPEDRVFIPSNGGPK